MEFKQLENMSDDLERESYDLMKSINALLYRVIPTDTDLKDDYTMAILGVLSNQARLVTDKAQNINMAIAELNRESKQVQ